MSTSIEWTDETWNPTRGCSKVSKGCTNCYAMRQAHRMGGRGGAYEGLTVMVHGKGPQWTGDVRLVPEKLDEPLHWRESRRVFVDSMSDLFHEDVPFSFIDRVFAVMAITPQHTYQILTKRPERAAEYSESRQEAFRRGGYGHPVQREIDRIINERPTPEDAGLWHWPLPNVWIGTSVEDQTSADERIPHLVRVPAAVRFLSCEPLLGPVDLKLVRHPVDADYRGWSGDGPIELVVTFAGQGIGWVIVGGESGPGARPMDVEWARSLVGQCRDAGVAAFVKQLGARPVALSDQLATRHLGNELALCLRDKKGGNPSEWPEDLRVREFPEAAHV